jgi:hypothetical protein
MLRCPLPAARCPPPEQDDAYASSQVYREAEPVWWCSDCPRGGRIYDLALLYRGGTCGASSAARRFGWFAGSWRLLCADAGCQRVLQTVAISAARPVCRRSAAAGVRRHTWN